MPGTKPARVEAAAAAAAAGPGSRPLLTDPPLQLCLLPEVAQLGCLPRPEAAYLARSPGRKQKPSGQSYCLDPGVGRHRRVKVRMCAFLFLFFARTTQNTAKKVQNTEKKQNTMARHCRKRTRDQGPTDRSTYQRSDVWTVSFCR